MSEKIGNLIIALLSVAILAVMILYATLPSFSYYSGKAQVQGTITVGEANFEFVNDLPLFASLANFTGGQIDESVSVINARDKSGSNTTNLVDCYLRFSITDNVALSINYDANKFLHSGNYFYYKGVFSVGQTVKLIESFEVDPANDESIYESGLNVSVNVDVMQATKSMISANFVGAPQEWVSILP